MIGSSASRTKVEWLRHARPTNLGASGSPVDESWAKTLPREAVWSIGRLKSKSRNGNSVLTKILPLWLPGGEWMARN